ncbi:hypothetical protein TNCV_635241 [Trichonephila clavipes]|nr:hypothetical protein TNCV_635241 [Trichonephila clavipes]
MISLTTRRSYTTKCQRTAMTSGAVIEQIKRFYFCIWERAPNRLKTFYAPKNSSTQPQSEHSSKEKKLRDNEDSSVPAAVQPNSSRIVPLT